LNYLKYVEERELVLTLGKQTLLDFERQILGAMQKNGFVHQTSVLNLSALKLGWSAEDNMPYSQFKRMLDWVEEGKAENVSRATVERIVGLFEKAHKEQKMPDTGKPLLQKVSEVLGEMVGEKTPESTKSQTKRF
jgi:hypothetical protein